MLTGLALLAAALPAAHAAAVWTRPDAVVPIAGRFGSALVRNLSAGGSPSHLFAFGGANGDGKIPDTWAYNMASNAWGDVSLVGETTLAVVGGAIAPVDASASVVSPTTYIFGGTIATGGTTNRLVSLTPTSGAVVVTTNGTAPSARRLAAAVHLANCYGTGLACLVVYGGTNVAGNSYLSDLYVLDMRVAPPRWSTVVPTGTPPTGRHSVSAIASADGKTALFFGGVTAAGAVNDLFVLAPAGFDDPRDNELTNIAQGKNATQYITDPTWAGGPQRAVDGILTTNFQSLAGATSPTQFTNNLCSHTMTMTDPWWRVEVAAAPTALHSVKIYDRTDCCAGRIAGFQIYVSNVDDFNTARAAGACTNPYTDIVDATATINFDLTPGGRCSVGRYVWIQNPGPNKILSLCEVQVRQKQPWVWRQLSGVAEVAQGKKTEQSSTELCCAGGDSSRAVDGDTSNNDYNRGSCAHTLTNWDQPNNAAWFLLDLQGTYDVTRLQVWPRTDCCTGTRNKRWNIAVGLSRDSAYNTPVPGVPADLAATPQWTFNMASATRGRYVNIWRSFVAGDDNILQICELKVFANLLLDQPAPRSAAASAGFAGFLMVFGGTDALGFKLNDLRLFDTINNRWLPFTAPLNTPPTARSSAAMLVLSSTRVALFGGSSATDPLSDVFYYDGTPCPALDLSPGGGVLTTTYSHGGSFVSFTCAPTFTHSNGGKPLVCDPSSGAWQGLYNMATGTVCLPTGPNAPVITSVSPLTTSSAVVNWSPPAGAGSSGLSFYIVEAAASAQWVERFATELGPADFLTAWQWFDLRQSSTYRFPTGNLRIDAPTGVDCNAGTPLGCPMLSRTWPSTVSFTDYAYEGWVAFDSNVVQNTQFAGLSLMLDNTGIGQNHTLMMYAGLYRSGSAWQLLWGTGTGTVSNAYTLTRPFYAAWFRIERQPTNPAAPWSPTDNPGIYRAAYRSSVRDAWVYLPGGALLDAQMPGGSFDPSRTRPGVVLRNANTGARAALLADDLRVYARTCTAAGSMRTVPVGTNTAVVSGLTSGATYRFTVTSATPAVVGATSLPSGAIVIPLSLATATPPPLTRNIAQGRPVQMTGRWSTTDYPAEMGVDGIVGPSNFFHTATPATGGCGDLGCWWQVDLGVQTDVQQLRVTNRYDSTIGISRAVGLEVVVSTVGGTGFTTSAGIICALNASELTSAAMAYTTNLTCAATGRYVTVRAPVGQILHLSEVSVFAANSCPERTASFADQLSGSVCGANATYGAICVQQCRPGYVAVSGAQTSVCRGSSWDAPALVCAPICPELPPPAYAEDCTRTLIADSFSAVNGSFNNTLARWVSLDPGNQPVGRAWFAGDGVVQAAARWGCNGELFLAAGTTGTRDYQGSFTLTAAVNTRDRAGVVRALDKANFLRFYLDVVEGVHVLDRSLNGVVTRISDVTMALRPNTWYTVALTQTGSVIDVYINGIKVLTALDRTFTVGYVGLYAGTQAMFDDFAMTTSCTSCAGAVPQDRCTFACRPGLIQTGNATRTCTLSPDGMSASWSGVDSICTLAPPVFASTSPVRAVAENSVRNSPVGDPLVAYLASPDETVSYALLATFPLPAAGAPFWIDRCSGQLRVRTPSVLDYESIRSFLVTVSAYVQGFDAAVTNRNVTVQILDVNEAPVIVVPQTINVSESASVGDIVGVVRYWDPENTTARFSIVADASNGMVAFANATAGTLAVASTRNLNFEGSDNRFELVVTATDTWDPTLSNTATLTLQVIDGPDLPTVPTGQVLRVVDSAGVGTAFANNIVATLEDNPSGAFNSPLSFSLIAPALAATFCALPNNGTGVEAPTTTGSPGSGLPLFAMANPSTGTLGVAALPANYSAWPARPTFGLDGNFARVVYTLCVNVSTRYRWIAAPVRAAVVANLGAVAQVNAYVVGNGSVGLTLDTVAPTPVTFLGSNLAGGAITANYSNRLGYAFAAGNCSILNASAVVCNSAPGVGEDLEWTLYKDGTPVPSTLQLLTSYAAPQVYAITNHTGMPHEGGREIIITGRYLGAVPVPGVGVYARLDYGPTKDNLKYTCNLGWRASWTSRAVRDTNAVCLADRGAGASLVWRLTVGGQTVDSPDGDTASLLSYIPPTISSIEWPSGAGGSGDVSTVNVTALSNLDTRGGARLILRGSGFGGDPTNMVTVRYTVPGGGSSSPSFTMASCDRLTPTTTTAVACVTAPGIGAGMSLVAEVEGQTSAPTSGNVTAGGGISYAAPVVTAVSGTAARSMATPGGDVFYVEGNMFGPDLAGSPDSVTYGPLATGGSKYPAVACTVFVPHVMLQCQAAPGTGKGHWLQAVIGGQATNLFNASLAYSPPVVAAFSGIGASNAATVGGQTVFITGANFGPTDANTPLNVTYTAKLDVGPILYYFPANCTVSVAHTELACLTDEGAGKDLNWFVTVDGQASVEPTTNYRAPSISAVYWAGTTTAVTTANVLGGDWLTVLGDNFGPERANGWRGRLLQALTYGPQGTEYAINVTSSVVWVSHTELLVRTPPGVGTNLQFRVTVADQVSPTTTARWSYAVPNIVGMTPKTARTYNDPNRPSKVTLFTRNLPLTDPKSLVRIYFGRLPYRRVIDLDMYPRTNASLQALTNPDGTVNVTFELPRDGGGEYIGVQAAIEPVVTTGGATFPTILAPATLRPENVFRYQKVGITNIALVRTRFRDGNATSSDAFSDIVFPCPPGMAANPTPTWNCSDPTLYTLVIYGDNFGGPPPFNTTGVPTGVSDGFGVIRSVEYGTTATTFLTAAQQASTFYLVRWDHTRVMVLTRRTDGFVRVSLSVPNATGTTNFVVRDVQQFARVSPTVVGVDILGGELSTRGNGVLRLRVQNIVGADNLYVSVGTDYNCTLLADASPLSAELTPATIPGYLNDPSKYTTVNGEQTWTLHCRMPPGQGAGLVVRVVRIIGAAEDVSDAGTTVSYAPPRIDQLVIDGMTVLTGLRPNSTAVTVATNGSVIRVLGSNLGVAPTLRLGEDYTITPDALQNCSGADAARAWPHECFEIMTPAGEGSGVGWPGFDPLTGFTWAVWAGNQESVRVLYRHAPPVVTAIVPEGGEYPTEGGVRLDVSGANFGYTKPGTGRVPDVRVTVVRGLDVVGDCAGVVRVDHGFLTCTLPEGSGLDVTLNLTVAGTRSVAVPVRFSYSKPLVFNVTVVPVNNVTGAVYYPNADGSLPVPLPVYDSVDPTYALYQRNYTLKGLFVDRPPEEGYMQVRGGTTGNDTAVIITGRNLGAWVPGAHCVCMAEVRRRASGSVCNCNNEEDFLGEGEVPSYRIVSWTHTRIVLRPNPGVGLKEFQLSVRGNGLPYPTVGDRRNFNFAYEPPRITSVVPAVGGTDGGYLVTVLGSNFGPAPRNFSDPLLTIAQEKWGDLEAPYNVTIPLEAAPSMPTAFLKIRFGRAVVPSGLDIGGQQPMELLSASGKSPDYTRRIVSWAHDRIVFEAPAGIGANRTISVAVVIGRGLSTVEWESAGIRFNYAPPTVERANPSDVYLTDTPQTYVSILGSNFGDDSRADEEEWTAEDRRLVVAFNKSLCEGTVTRERELADGSIFLRCLISPNTTVGYNSITVTAAGQTGVSPAWPPSKALHAVCAQGFFGRPTNDTCVRCPRFGAFCPGYLQYVSNYEARHTYPVPLPGWYNLNGTQAGGCPGPQTATLPGKIPGRDVCIVPCQPLDACLGDNYCSEGYMSKAPYYRCASCASGFYKRAGQCIKCPDSPFMLVIGFILLVIFAAALGVILQRKQVNIAVVSIGVDYFQILAIFSNSDVQWPPAVKELFHILSAFNLNIEIVAPECLVPDVSYTQKFAAVMLLPLAVGGAMALMSLGLVLFKVAKGRRRNELLRHSSTMVGLVLVLLYFLYLYETRTLLDIFNCTPTTPPDGKMYLQAVFEECGVPGGTQVTLIPWAIIGLVVYTVGYPAFVSYWVLWRNRELIMEDQLLRAKGVGNDRLTNPHAYDLRRKYSRSYFQFKPDYYFWFGAIIIRKFCIAATSILFNMNASFQMAASLLIMFCAYGLQLACRPYMSPSEYDAVLKDHTEKSFTSAVHARIRSAIINVESRGRKRTRRNLMTPEGKVDRSAVLGILGNWLFNYNTVEAAMLWAAVIVCLMGLMYDALSRGYASAYADKGLDSVTSVVLAVIIISILYFFTVLLSEAFILYTEDQREKAMKAAAARKGSKKGISMTDGSGSKRNSVGGPLGSVPTGLARGSIYEKAGGAAGFATGPVESSFNPLALAAAKSEGGLGMDAASMNVADSVAGMSGPPPPEVWRVFQGAFKDLHSQVVEGRLREAELMTQLASSGPTDPLGGKAKAVYEPTAASHGGGSAGTPGDRSSLGSALSSRSPLQPGASSSNLGAFKSAGLGGTPSRRM